MYDQEDDSYMSSKMFNDMNGVGLTELNMTQKNFMTTLTIDKMWSALDFAT